MSVPRSWRMLVPLLACLAASGAACPARAQVAPPDSVAYALEPSASRFEWGCFGPCACPVVVHASLGGTFMLRRSHVDPLYEYYDVLDVRWTAPDAVKPVGIQGAGVYRRGGEFALVEQMTLDLSFDGGPAQRFDSGLVPVGAAFPEISTRLSLHETGCFDSVLVVDAKPAPTVLDVSEDAGGSLRLSPNPTRLATQVSFTLARTQPVELAIFDPGGRRVKTLIAGERLAPGLHVRAWDGRLDGGAEAAAGVYLVRLTTPESTRVLRLAKLR